VAEQEVQLLLDENRAQEAATMLQGILSRETSAKLLDLLGEAQSQLRDYTNAEKAYRQAVEMEPEEPAHHRGLAQALVAQEKFEDALAQYQRLAAMDADDPENYLQMAEMDRQLHRLDEAEKNIVQAKQRAPGNLEVVYSEAMIYEAQGRYEDAIRVLSSAVASLKSDTTAAPSRRRSLAVLFEQLGRVYRETEKYSAALNTFNELGALGDEEARRADLQIVDTYRAERDLPHALDAAEKALKRHPRDRDLRVTHALLLGDKGEPDQAAALLRELLVRSPEDLEIDLDLGQVYQQNRRYAEAEAALAQALQVATRDSDREMVWFMLGATFEREKKYDQAEEEFKRVLAANPKSAPVLNYYGYMLADRGVRLEEATDFIKRALAGDPDNGSYLDSLGWAYYKQDKLEEAEDSLRQAAERVHNDATILEHLGDVYAKRGKLVQAAAQWQHAIDEWHRAVPADVEPNKIAALEAKLSTVKQRIAQQKTGGKIQPLEN
jgi:tetratricopeptide (TPR) repeat protein